MVLHVHSTAKVGFYYVIRLYSGEKRRHSTDRLMAHVSKSVKRCIKNENAEPDGECVSIFYEYEICKSRLGSCNLLENITPR